MIYLIGGPARCGKSTLAARVRKEIDGQILAGDAFVHALQETLKPEWLPDIYDHDVASVRRMPDNQSKVDRLRRRDEMMWQFYAAYIRAATCDTPQDDILLEGNIWPDFLESFTQPHKAVFLVDTSTDQVERLRTIREGNSDNNWMLGFTDERLVEWATFNVERSMRYVALCQEYGYPYFDIRELGVQGAQGAAASYLLEKAYNKDTDRT